MEKQPLLNTYINNVTMAETVTAIEQMIAGNRKSYVVAINELIREAIADASKRAISYEDFQRILSDEYGIFVKNYRGRYSYLPPEREKYISERSLGENCKKEHLEVLFNQNAMENLRYKEEPLAIFTTRTRLRLVVDLQENVKAQESMAYAMKVKISNLQKMAETLVWVQGNNIHDLDELNERCDAVSEKAQAAQEQLSQAEEKLHKVNERIHYTRQYLTTKDVQQKFAKAVFKKKFGAEYSKELDAYAEAVKYLKQKNDGKIPLLKSLKAQKAELIKEIAELKNVCAPLRAEQQKLKTAKENVYAIFQQTDKMRSDLEWQYKQEAQVREYAQRAKARQIQREYQPKRKKRSNDMEL